jgi:hypothetical protein
VKAEAEDNSTADELEVGVGMVLSFGMVDELEVDIDMAVSQVADSGTAVRLEEENRALLEEQDIHDSRSEGGKGLEVLQEKDMEES